MRWVLVLVLCGTLIACRGDDGPSEEDTAVRDATTLLLTQVKDDQYSDAWESLHPAHQAVITREHLIECGERFPVNCVSFDILDVETREWTEDEVGTVDAWIVDVRFESNDEYKTDTGTMGIIDRPFQWTLVDGEWRWFVRGGELSTFRDGGCGVPWAVFSTAT